MPLSLAEHYRNINSYVYFDVLIKYSRPMQVYVFKFRVRITFINLQTHRLVECILYLYSVPFLLQTDIVMYKTMQNYLNSIAKNINNRSREYFCQ